MVFIYVISTNIVEIDIRSNKTLEGFNNSPCKCTGVHMKAKIRILERVVTWLRYLKEVYALYISSKLRC